MPNVPALVLALLVLVGCAQGVSISDQRIEGSRLPDRPLVADLLVPSAAGPFAVVILLHGCGGIGPGIWDWARRLNSWGYAALVLNSFSSRGATSVCAPDKQRLVTPRDRAGDVISAALWLRTQPNIDGDRIGVLGQSHGGRTAALVTERRYEQLYPGLLKAAVDYYGGCGSAQVHGTVPLLALAGEADNWGNPAVSCRALGGALASNQPFEVFTYPGVVHGFDNSATPPHQVLGHPLRYDAVAAADSYQRVHTFLDKWLRPAQPAS
jgi:dienelactone hydrolase